VGQQFNESAQVVGRAVGLPSRIGEHRVKPIERMATLKAHQVIELTLARFFNPLTSRHVACDNRLSVSLGDGGVVSLGHWAVGFRGG
jgi:hypothetical protein